MAFQAQSKISEMLGALIGREVGEGKYFADIKFESF